MVHILIDALSNEQKQILTDLNEYDSVQREFDIYKHQTRREKEKLENKLMKEQKTNEDSKMEMQRMKSKLNEVR